MPLTIKGYTVGRVSSRGEPCAPHARFDPVVAVHPNEIEQMMSCRDQRVLRAHLRRLRDRRPAILILPTEGAPDRVVSYTDRQVQDLRVRGEPALGHPASVDQPSRPRTTHPRVRLVFTPALG